MTRNQIWTARGAGFIALVAGAVLASPLATLQLAKKPPHAAQVTFLEGKASRTEIGSAVEGSLKVGDELAQGDLIATEMRSRLELKLDDKSVIRLGPSAKIALTEAQFSPGEQTRKLSVKLFFGNIWAKVTSAVSGDQRFAIETENAVAGVRGTTFRVDAHADQSVLVRVYAGAVAVAKPIPIYAADLKSVSKGGKSERREVAGPDEVSRAAWEKLVGAQMEIAVSAKGVPGEPSSFSAADEQSDSWSKWNQERDAK